MLKSVFETVNPIPSTTSNLPSSVLRNKNDDGPLVEDEEGTNESTTTSTTKKVTVNMTEQTPLLLTTDRVVVDEEEEVGDAVDDDDDGRIENSRTKSTNNTSSSSWNSVKDHLRKGHFILYNLSNRKNGEEDEDVEAGDNSISQLVRNKTKNCSGQQQLQQQGRELVSTSKASTKEEESKKASSSSGVADPSSSLPSSIPGQHILDEIKSGISFTPTQCLVAIFLYLSFAVLCYTFFFERDNWTIIDTVYFAVATFSKYSFQLFLLLQLRRTFCLDYCLLQEEVGRSSSSDCPTFPLS